MFKNTLLALILLSSLHAANYSFVDTSVNYLNWSNSTEENSLQKDFVYLELEGGAGWDWGEFYGFFDIENPLSSYDDKPANDLRFVAKPIVDIYLKHHFSLHLQNFIFHSKSFYVSNSVAGLSYKYSSGNFWIIPFLGAHYLKSTYYSGFQGYMAGWNFSYDFKLFNQKLNLFNWNEIEFARAKESYESADGVAIGDAKSYGINGALSLWYKIIPSLSLGVQQRYAKYKLGSPTLQSGQIYSLKYYY